MWEVLGAVGSVVQMFFSLAFRWERNDLSVAEDSLS